MLDRNYERSQVSPPRLVHGPRAGNQTFAEPVPLKNPIAKDSANGRVSEAKVNSHRISAGFCQRVDNGNQSFKRVVR